MEMQPDRSASAYEEVWLLLGSVSQRRFNEAQGTKQRPFLSMKFCWILGSLIVFASTLAAQTGTALPLAPAAPKGTPPMQRDPFDDPLIQQVSARQHQAAGGDAQETKRLTADLEKWTAEQPQNHLLQAYLGSLYTLCSRDAWPGPGKLTYLRRGGQLLDEAVAADPENPAVRFVRAIDFFELPGIFGKRQAARDDFELLVRQVDGEVRTPYTLNVETSQAIYYYAGLSFQQQWLAPEAKATWQRGVEMNPASPLGLKMRGELDKLK